jgi:cyclin G-associated kinase
MQSTVFVLLFRQDLDQVDTPDKYPENFVVTLDVIPSPNQRPRTKDQTYPWDNFTPKGLNPKLLFLDREEMSQVVVEYCKCVNTRFT